MKVAQTATAHGMHCRMPAVRVVMPCSPSSRLPSCAKVGGGVCVDPPAEWRERCYYLPSSASRWSEPGRVPRTQASPVMIPRVEL